MDWFEPEGPQATAEIRAVNRAMKLGGRVLLRSAGLRPWYIANFSAQGFACERVAARTSGTCIDRCVSFSCFFWAQTRRGLTPTRGAQGEHVRVDVDLHEDRSGPDRGG